jgi:hypothetical protein
MIKRLFATLALICAVATIGFAQNANTARPRTSTTQTPPQGIEEAGAQTEAKPTPTPARKAVGRRAAANRNEPTTKDVLAVFNSLIAGIEAVNVEAVTGVYWNSPQLTIYNSNGTVTRGWEQMRKNVESSYSKLKDVKVESRDVRTQMLGRDGAVVSFLWTQSQTYNDTPETATGRTTLVFRRIGTAWKVVHRHTSPEGPDPSRILPSERTTPTPTPTPTPKTPGR